MSTLLILSPFSAVTHRITAISTAGDYIITGDENGDLVLRDLLTPKVVQSLALQLPIQVTAKDDGIRTSSRVLLKWRMLIPGSWIRSIICS